MQRLEEQLEEKLTLISLAGGASAAAWLLGQGCVCDAEADAILI